MYSTRWRVMALAFIACALAYVAYQFTLPNREDFGIAQFVVPARAAGSIRVLSVEPNSPAARAGIRPGDLLDYGGTAIERAHALFARAGDRVHVVVNGTRSVVLVARAQARLNNGFAVTAVRLAFLFVAALLAWRRPDDKPVRALVVFLWAYGAALGMGNGVLPTPVLSLIVVQIVNISLYAIGTAAAAEFAATFPSGAAQPLPRALANLTITIAVLMTVAIAAGTWIPRTGAGFSIFSALVLASFVLTGVIVVAILASAYIQGEASEKQRRRWVFLALGVGLSGPIVDVIVQNVFGFQAWVDQWSLLPLGVLPFTLAYAILRHRVIDVGFVLSRAVVYASVSILIVGIFVLLETLLAKYVENANHIESLTVQLAVALALGFSIRAIHSRVDGLVDALLFRERHASLDALASFAQDAPFITDTSILLARAIGAAERYAGARAAGIWLQSGELYEPAASTFEDAAAVDANDAAALAMRARHVSVDLPAPDSALPGGIAFPMAVRGELLGFLVCAAKSSDEAYDPDERQALAAVATSVALGLGAIELRELRRTVAMLTATREAPAAL